MPHWRRNVWVIAAANFVTIVGMTAFIPFFPDVLRQMGIREPRLLGLWAGVLTAAAPLTACVMGPIWGALGDRYGRKPMMVRSLAAIVIFVGLMGWVTSPWAHLSGWWRTPWPLLILRLGQGCFSGYIAPALTLVTVGAPLDRHSRITALQQVSLVMGTVVGPCVGGTLAGEFGRAWMTFLFCAGASALATLVVVLFATEVRRTDLEGSEGGKLPAWPALRRAWDDSRGLLATGGLLGLMTLLFLIQVGACLPNPVMRLHVDRFHAARPEALTGYAFSIFALGEICFAPLWARWAERVGPVRVIRLTAGLTAAALLPMGILRTSRAFLGLRFVQGAVWAGTVPAVYTRLGSLSAEDRRGGAYGLLLSASQFAYVLGPLAGGLLAAAFGTPPLFSVSAGLLAAAALGMRGKS